MRRSAKLSYQENGLKRKREIIREEKAITYRKWRRYLEGESQAGRRTLEAVLPVWESWLGRKHGMMSFHLTQLLTGHGVFYTYLKRIQKADSDSCPHCNQNLQDSMEHTLIQCEAWREQRVSLISKLDINVEELTLIKMVEKMVDSKEMWTAAYSFAESVMYNKEEHERRLEAEAYATQRSRPSSDGTNEDDT